LAFAYSSRAYAHFWTRNIDKALSDYTEASRLDPKILEAVSEAALSNAQDPKLVQAVMRIPGAVFIDTMITPEGDIVAVLLVNGEIQFLENWESLK